MNYEQRWKIVRPLGKGGQGTVDLVREETQDDRQRLTGLFGSWPSSSAVYYENEREKRQKEAIELLSQIMESRLRPNLGALKQLHGDNTARDPVRSHERAALEIETMRKWQHPNLLALKDSDGGELWYVSEFHGGGTLDRHPAKYAGNLLSTLTALRPLVEGVALLHKNDVVHRDIKPHNIFVSDDGKLVLGDFGLVYVRDPDNTRLSATYSNVGTHAWMPGWAMDHRVSDLRPTFDVFSLGKVVWSMLSGEPMLPLWYYDRPQYNLEHKFPDKPEMRWANGLFSKCVVEDEHNCMRSASDLLGEINTIVERLSKGASFFDTRGRTCRMCHIGEYQEIRGSEKRNFGLNCGGTYDVALFVCENCRHLELFYFDGKNPPSEQRHLNAKLE